MNSGIAPGAVQIVSEDLPRLPAVQTSSVGEAEAEGGARNASYDVK